MSSLLSFTALGDSSETLDISEATRRFAEDTLRLNPGEEPRFKREDFDGFASLGLCGMSVPDSLGGNAVEASTIASVLFEIARVQLGPAIYLSVHLMVARLLSNALSGFAEISNASNSPQESSDRNATKEDKSLLEITKQLAEGRKLAAFCLTEANAGSDAANLQTKAEFRDGQWLITGEKLYITSAGNAEIYYVFARTGEPGAKDAISAFIVEKRPQGSPNGLSFGKEERKMGCSGSPIASVRFQETPAQLVGAPGEGYRMALQALAGGRVNIAACACALSSRAIELATAHLESRKQFGHFLSEFQGLQFMLSDMLMKHRASVLLTRDACRSLEANEQPTLHAAIAKCFSTDSAMSVTTDAVQLLGGAGYLKEFEVERLMRDAKMLQIVEGTNQIQRTILAKSYLRSDSPRGV